MIIYIYNKLTGRQKLHKISSWKDALHLADLVGHPTEIHHLDSLMKFSKRIGDSLANEHTVVVVKENPKNITDPWDISKAVRPRFVAQAKARETELINRPHNPKEPLKKSLSDSDIKDKEIEDQIVNRLGGDKRKQELDDINELYKTLIKREYPQIAAHPAASKELATLIKMHEPAAANVSTDDIKKMLDGGLSEISPMGNFFANWEHESDLPHGTSVRDLLLAQKDKPHHKESNLLKYIVHQVRTMGSSDPDANFLSNASEGPTKPAHLLALRRMLLNHPHLISEALKTQRDQENFVRQHFPRSVKMIDGVPHVALSRGLDSKEHGGDSTLASYADEPHPPFGSRTFRYWVPMNHIWNHYDLTTAGRDNVYHSEDEALVDSWHPRIPATEEDVKNIVPRKIWSTNREDVHPVAAVAHACSAYGDCDHLPVKDVLKALSDYSKGERGRHGFQGFAKGGAGTALKHKDITGDDLLALVNPDDEPPQRQIWYRDIMNHPKMDTHHHMVFREKAIQQAERASRKRTDVDDNDWWKHKMDIDRSQENIPEILTNNANDLSEEQKHRLAKALTDRQMNDNHDAGWLGADSKESNNAVLKIFANTVPNADTYLRPQGTSVKELRNIDADPKYPGPGLKMGLYKVRNGLK